MSRWRYHCGALLLFIVALLVFPGSPGLAAVLDLHLQKTIDGALPGAELPVIVTFQGQGDLPGLPPESRRAQRAELVRKLKLRAEMAQRSTQAFLHNRGVGRMQELWINNSLAVTASPEIILALAARPEVVSVRLEEVLHAPPVMPAQVNGTAELHVNLINAPAVWALGFTGQGVTVATMDTGVDINHPDLEPRWRGGANSWFDPNGEHPLAPVDMDGHGTAVMGTLVGGNAGGTFIGVAPAAQWIAVKIFNDAQYATETVIHLGFQWLLDPDGNPDTDDAPDVVNNSWGFEDATGECLAVFRPDLQALKAAGIGIVFSAGNGGSGSDTSVSPANYPEAFAVGALGTIESATEISTTSARGPSACDGTIFPEVVAPGFFVKTADTTQGGLVPDAYVYVTGSSIAAPQVAGVMALLLSAHPTLSINDLEQAILDGANDLGAAGPDNAYGYGLVDALAALVRIDEQILGNTPPAPAILKTPADGSTGLPTTLILTWSQPPDADGDLVTNTVQIDTNPHFPDPLVVSWHFGAEHGVWLGSFGLAACLLPLGWARLRRRRWLACTVGIVMVMLVIGSCGGGGGGGDSGSGDDPTLRSRTVANLLPGTTYYWRVLSQDARGGTSISETFSFTTGG